MTSEELLELLKGNLRVEVSKERPYDNYGSSRDDVVVSIYFGSTLITESST